MKLAVLLIMVVAGCTDDGVDPLVNFRVPIGGRCQPDPDHSYPMCAVIGSTVGTEGLGGTCYKGTCHRKCSALAIPPEPLCPDGGPMIRIDEPPDLHHCICTNS